MVQLQMVKKYSRVFLTTKDLNKKPAVAGFFYMSISPL